MNANYVRCVAAVSKHTTLYKGSILLQCNHYQNLAIIPVVRYNIFYNSWHSKITIHLTTSIECNQVEYFRLELVRGTCTSDYAKTSHLGLYATNSIEHARAYTSMKGIIKHTITRAFISGNGKIMQAVIKLVISIDDWLSNSKIWVIIISYREHTPSFQASTQLASKKR